MKIRHVFIVLVSASALFLQACGAVNSEAAIQTGVAQTLQIAELQTAAAGGGQVQASATAQAQVTNTPENTATPAFTATSSIPFVTVSQNTNCRRGPSSSYGLVTTISTNQQVEVLKTYSGANYVVVRNPNGSGDCWLWLEYASPTNFSSYNLPAATQPPTPTPTFTPTPSFNWAGTWNIKAVSGGSTYSGSMSCTISGSGEDVNCNGELDPGDLPYTFGGDLSANRQQVSGNFGGTGSGTWAAMIKSGNLNQFIGNLDSGTWEFCGWRSGSSAPDPCEWP
jgi:hypothetical protein